MHIDQLHLYKKDLQFTQQFSRPIQLNEDGEDENQIDTTVPVDLIVSESTLESGNIPNCSLIGIYVVIDSLLNNMTTGQLQSIEVYNPNDPADTYTVVYTLPNVDLDEPFGSFYYVPQALQAGKCRIRLSEHNSNTHHHPF